MKQKAKDVIGSIVDNADDFHNFLVLVIPALKAWVKGHTGKGVKELARELHRKLDVEFDEARDAIEAKHASGPQE